MLKNRFTKTPSTPTRTSPPDPQISSISGTEGMESPVKHSLTYTDHGMASHATNPEEAEKVKPQKKLHKAPPGTYEYTVKDGENLRSLAAQFDTTPSVLKKLNRLTMDFLYPGQVLRIPDQDYVALNTEPNIDKADDKHSSKELAEKIKKSSKSFPGRIIRTSTSCHSIEDDSELPPRPLSHDEAEYLDQECFERFIKVNSHYITEHNGPVDGVLLVTPNAVMFDPNVSNPLVIEKGAEEFGMIAKMDTVMSAAIYHNMDAMDCLHKRRSDPRVEAPLVYHAQDCSSSTTPQPESADLASDDLQRSDEQEVSCSCSDEAAAEHDIKPHEEAAADATCDNVEDRLSPEEAEPPEQPPEPNKPTASFSVGDAVLLNPSDLANISLQRIELGNTSREEAYESPASWDSGKVVDSLTNTESVENTSDSQADSNNVLESCDGATGVSGAQGDSGAPGVPEAPENNSPEMMPNGLVSDPPPPEPSLYLCLRVGQPINKAVSTACPIESYSRKKRPEYWFSIPRDKVDQLYAFFIQWKAEVYDNEDNANTELGFVAITDSDALDSPSSCSTTPPPDSSHVTHHLGHQVSLDWEIISIEEVRRRRTIEDMERYIPLPELKSESLILNESHIKQIVKCLPARVEGYPWALAFGSEQHGYSLNQLYRNMHNVDSPVLLVIQTTDDQIFGAVSSCAFHMSDLFYGTGESFLFTFVDGFKTYPWTGTNSFFNKGDQTCLSIGSGEGSNGIWIDGDIYLGRTQNCQTYANDPLTMAEEDFHIKQTEVWWFHDE